MTKIRIGDICMPKQSHKWTKENSNKEFSYIDLSSVNRETKSIIGAVSVNKDNAPSRAKQVVKTGDVLFGTTRPLLKRSCIVGEDYDGQLCSTGFCLIRPNTDVVDPNYLHRIICSQSFYDYINPLQSGISYPAISDKDVYNYSICLPPLSEQQSIAAELDAIQFAIDGYKEQLGDLDALAQSIFLDTFGDVTTNSKCWDIIPMGQLGDFKNGLNYSKGERGKVIKKIGVGDFKNIKSLTSFDGISSIEVENFSQEYLLNNEDLVFVRSNGNKNLVGRCLEVYPNNTELTFSGFCIRFRKSVEIINKYLIALLTDTGFKEAHILKSNGIGIQNINQKLLSNLAIPLPPLPLQQQFATQVEAIEQQKELIRLQLADAETLMAERMQYYFS